MNDVVRIPLSGNPLTQPSWEVGDRQATRRTVPAALDELIVGPENQLLIPAVEYFIELAHTRSTPKPAAANSKTCRSGQSTTNPTESVAVQERFNPLLLAGPPGTGKSHVALGIAELWRDRRPQDRVVLRTGADLWRELHAAFQLQTVDSWREELRTAELLVIEDVGQLATKHAAQAELWHLLDDALARQAGVIVTSRLEPAQMTTLLPGLRARLEQGYCLTLNLPSQPTRRVILERRAAQLGLAVHPAAVTELAQGVVGTAAELFGALTTLAAEAALEPKASSPWVVLPADAQRFVVRREESRRPSMRGIAVKTARHFNVKLTDLKSASRSRTVVAARDVAMYLARKLTGKSFEQIGVYFGGRDHTTVLHGCRKMENLVRTDASTRQAVEQLQAVLVGHGL